MTMKITKLDGHGSFIDQLAASKKVNGSLAMDLRKMDEGTARNKISLKLIFQASAAVQKDEIEGVSIRTDITNSIYTAEASLDGLKNLINDSRVTSITGNRRLGPV